MTEAWDRCLVGRVSEDFQKHFGRLEGRLAQVVEIYSNSTSSKKKEYSSLNDGVFHATLVDKGTMKDSVMTKCLRMIDSDSDSDEN